MFTCNFSEGVKADLANKAAFPSLKYNETGQENTRLQVFVINEYTFSYEKTQA